MRFITLCLVLLTISGLTLLITAIATREVVVEWRQWQSIHALKEASTVSQSFFNIIEHLSREREITVAMLLSHDEAINRRLAPRLQA